MRIKNIVVETNVDGSDGPEIVNLYLDATTTHPDIMDGSKIIYAFNIEPVATVVVSANYAEQWVKDNFPEIPVQIINRGLPSPNR